MNAVISSNNPIESMREINRRAAFHAELVQYEHGRPLLYPAVSRCAERFPAITGQIDSDALFLAQQLARFARHCSPAQAEKRINQANYQLTAAYKGGAEHEAFWNQFL